MLSYISRESWVLLFCYYCAILWCAQIIDGRVRFFAQDTTSLSSFCRRIWNYWTSKMFFMYMLSSVCLRSSQLSWLSFMQYMGLCVISLRVSLVIIMIIWLYIILFLETLLPLRYLLNSGGLHDSGFGLKMSPNLWPLPTSVYEIAILTVCAVISYTHVDLLNKRM